MAYASTIDAAYAEEESRAGFRIGAAATGICSRGALRSRAARHVPPVKHATHTARTFICRGIAVRTQPRGLEVSR